MKLYAFSALAAALVVFATQAVAQANKDFTPSNAPELVRSFELRDRYKLPKHIGETAIYVDSVSVHHIRSEASTIVWKDATGQWHRSQAVETGPGGLLSIEQKLESNDTNALSAAEANSVESLIKDPSLYSGEVHRTGELGIGAPFHVMAIITPYGRTTVKWDGRLLGTTGKLADIVLGHD
jgi:hypothetical protein